MREEQDRAGAVELLMPTLQSADLWRQSGRYDAYGPEMLRIRDRHDRDMLYGPTNEEMITALFRDAARSYRDLPRILYHIQWKFRDEVRPRFGVMRGREFLMKDAYSFDLDEAGLRGTATRRCSSPICAPSPRMGLTRRPDEGADRPDRRRPQPRIPSSSPTPARARSSTTRRSRTVSPTTELLAADASTIARPHRRSTRRRRRSMPRSRDCPVPASGCAAAAASRSATSSPSAPSTAPAWA